jgi:hypothetical protein
MGGNSSSCRNYGIDLLKIVCMLMIPVIHILGHGGIIFNLPTFTLKYEVTWILECMVFCAVNCYALITGFLYYGRRFKYSNILRLYCQAVFYGTLIFFFFYFKDPASVSRMDFVKAVFPFAYTDRYWYFRAYFYLFFAIPFLNKMIDKSTKREATILVLSAFLLVSVIPTFFQQDVVGTNSGYSTFWLVIMYLFGAYIKKYDLVGKLKNGTCILGYLACVALLWFSRCGMEYITQHQLGYLAYNWIFFSYPSPLVVGAAVFLFLLFANFSVLKGLQRPIAFFAPLSFGVYLLHDNPLFRANYITDKFQFLMDKPLPIMLLSVIGLAVAIWLFGSMVDYLRTCIFKLLRISKLCDRATVEVSTLAQRVIGE